jgi:hypothetical protein
MSQIFFLQNEFMARPEDDDDFTFRCRTWLQDYTFNIKTKRFVSVFVPHDYVQRETAPSDAAPAIFGGSCTKFEELGFRNCLHRSRFREFEK